MQTGAALGYGLMFFLLLGIAGFMIRVFAPRLVSALLSRKKSIEHFEVNDALPGHSRPGRMVNWIQILALIATLVFMTWSVLAAMVGAV